jgi:hypothetical integral membrane protein (TIGR02206 family)
MNSLVYFFSNQESHAPVMTLPFYAILMGLLIFFAYTTIRYYKNESYRRFFQVLQMIQLLLIYGWYALMIGNFKESLPLYHCRLAMLMVLFLPDKHSWKRYFALIGIFGPILAFAYPVMDNYSLFHVTIFSFIVGHYALFVNSLLYLLRFPRKDLLDKPKVIIGTLSFSSLLLLVNQITGGNYGFLRETPLIGGASAPFRFLAVSMVFIFLILTFDFFFWKYGKVLIREQEQYKELANDSL